MDKPHVFLAYLSTVSLSKIDSLENISMLASLSLSKKPLAKGQTSGSQFLFSKKQTLLLFLIL